MPTAWGGHMQTACNHGFVQRGTRAAIVQGSLLPGLRGTSSAAADGGMSSMDGSSALPRPYLHVYTYLHRATAPEGGTTADQGASAHVRVDRVSARNCTERHHQDTQHSSTNTALPAGCCLLHACARAAAVDDGHVLGLDRLCEVRQKRHDHRAASKQGEQQTALPRIAGAQVHADLRRLRLAARSVPPLSEQHAEPTTHTKLRQLYNGLPEPGRCLLGLRGAGVD